MIAPRKVIAHQGDTVRALDLFCGAGLASAGARAAGALIVGGVDLNTTATETYRNNFLDAVVVNRRLEDIRLHTLRKKVGPIDLLLASPECTNHTCAKGSAPRSEASRATAMQTLRYARSFKPRWIVMENVVHMRPWSRYSELIEGLRDLGYHIREQIIDASDFGVPQKRRRLFVICDRKKLPAAVVPKAPSHKRSVAEILDPDELWDMTPLFRKNRAADTKARARRAIAELGDELPFLIVYYGSDGSGGWQAIDRPLRTVTTVDRFALVRPTAEGHKMRMLQVSELKRAMGLADDFLLSSGTRRDKVRVLGNGVCPPVMTAVVKLLSENR
jgi:DNA (cytosine-5)-methyltransferase 1